MIIKRAFKSTFKSIIKRLLKKGGVTTKVNWLFGGEKKRKKTIKKGLGAAAARRRS